MTIGHRVFGQGTEKVLLLHGWFGDHSAYDPLEPWLETEAFSFAFMDARGYGLSRTHAGDYSIAETGGDALALADHLGWERFHVIGHSMGGMAMQWIAAHAPKRVKSGIGLTPVPACGVPLDGDGQALFHGAVTELEKRRQILSFTTGGRLGAFWERTCARFSWEISEPAAFAGHLAAWTETDFAAAMAGLQTPMLIVVGEHDAAITADAMRSTLLSWCPQAELEVMANAGHYPMQETPVRLANLMQAFLRRHA